MPNQKDVSDQGWPAALLMAAARFLLLAAVLFGIGSLWLAVAIGGGAPAWVERSALMSAVAFGVYWLLGWWRGYSAYRGVLLTITVALVLPALALVFAIEPWQRAEMQRRNAMLSNQAHADGAIERFPCPGGALLVVTPWIFILNGDELRRLVELRLIPADRQKPSRLLLRHTAHGDLAYREELSLYRDTAIQCVGNAGALDSLIRRMGEGEYE